LGKIKMLIERQDLFNIFSYEKAPEPKSSKKRERERGLPISEWID
jgi:hypothetical protein